MPAPSEAFRHDGPLDGLVDVEVRLAQGHWLIEPSPPLDAHEDARLTELLGTSNELFAKLHWVNARFSAEAFLETCHRVARGDKEGLCKASTQANLAYRVAESIVSLLESGRPEVLAEALVRTKAFHCLLEAGVVPHSAVQEDRNCLAVVAQRWLHHDHTQVPAPFSQPGALGVLACLANLAISHDVAIEHTISDPTGRSSSLEGLLKDDPDLGPYLVWEKREFSKGILDAMTRHAHASMSRPRL